MCHLGSIIFLRSRADTSIFVFVLGLQSQNFWSGFGALAKTLGQQDSFQSQIGGNCD